MTACGSGSPMTACGGLVNDGLRLRLVNSVGICATPLTRARAHTRNGRKIKTPRSTLVFTTMALLYNNGAARLPQNDEKGRHEGAAAEFPFISDIGGSGCASSHGANFAAHSRASQ
jgi:hypothetical protein